MKQVLALTGVLLLPVGAWADVVTMKGGGELRGVVVERRADAVVIEVGPGLVTVPMSRVARISGGGNELAEYRLRAARIPADDAEAWVTLGSWADAHGLSTQARESFEHALAVDYRNEGAHMGLGHVRVGGRWLNTEEAYRAQGYESFEGRWVRPEERSAILEERAMEAGRRLEMAESDARVREADARARAAEAEARRAETEAQTSGIPYGYGSGGIYGPVILSPWTRVHPGGHYGGTYGSGYGPRYHPVAPPAVQPPPPPPPRDNGSTRNPEHETPPARHSSGNR